MFSNCAEPDIKAAHLVGRRIAVAADPVGDPDAADVEIHPDVLFALSPTDAPAPADI